MTNSLKFFAFILMLISCVAGKEEPSGPPELINTTSRPTSRQWKGIRAFQDSTIFFSNDFDGGRLSGLIMDSTNHFMAVITAENYPINPSPWYAFKVWSKTPKSVRIVLTYTNSRNRYYPKISTNGQNFSPIDSAKVNGFERSGSGIDNMPESIEIHLELSKDTLWIAAQELWTSTDIDSWIDDLVQVENITQTVIGSSVEGRPVRMLEIGNKQAKRGILVISRQHPPEVTGFLAMKSFIETIAGNTYQAIAFRKNFMTYNIPLMNPDGVDNGHWRHNMGGIDLNRDWQEFNQPETSAVRDFLNRKKAEGFEFVFASDFHSTWKDIYYPLDSTLVDENALFIFDWIEKIAARLSVDDTNVAPSVYLKPTMVSRNYFYNNHNIPAIVFELGDNADREFIKKKGKAAAEELMAIILSK
ncbi:MAG: hypothetical protein GDA37_01185 [Ekhidna sp.]|nr:hypothetical protein [Ekhidna sp.]